MACAKGLDKQDRGPVYVLAKLLPGAATMTTSLLVSTLMKSPVLSVAPDTLVDEAYLLLASRRISSAPVVDAAGKALGVVSLTDLLRIGRLQPASLAGIQPIDLPTEPVSDHMHKGVITVSPNAPVTAAARAMAEEHVHRVYVEQDGKLVGVFSIEEVLSAVRALRLEGPIGEVMTKPVISLPVTATIADATSRLDRAQVTGLVILDEYKHPVGVFTQVEALAARSLAPETKVEDVMNYAILTQHVKTPLYRAAAHAYESRARRVLVLENGDLVGLITGLDFARVLAATA
ncbi:CBS domain-containing protein [Polyangium spumosum]|uniref:CBS domain-containing protein n=2 Tax=Polyangium spumosum TaxID=889282 RepID=A0A6N7PZB4_9BACT|nr:CBS domain-containing protein [Polyangium spumosum]